MLKIYFWGPRGSGKSWLLYSFIKRIQQISQVLKQHSLYELSMPEIDGTGGLVSVNLSDLPGATEDPLYREFVYMRKGLYPGLKGQVNTHAHKIGMLDGPGEEVIGYAADNPDNANNEQIQNAVSAARETLKESQSIVLVLDPGGDSQDEKERFIEYFSRMCRFIVDNPLPNGQPRFIAPCITKADALGQGLEKGGYRGLLIRRFGSLLTDDIEQWFGYLMDSGCVVQEPTAVSAVGYMDDDNTRKPNLKPDSTGLSNPNDWRPERVEIPLFWLLGKMEAIRLDRQQQTQNRGLYYRLFKGVSHRQREQVFESYGELMQIHDNRLISQGGDRDDSYRPANKLDRLS